MLPVNDGAGKGDVLPILSIPPTLITPQTSYVVEFLEVCAPGPLWTVASVPWMVDGKAALPGECMDVVAFLKAYDVASTHIAKLIVSAAY
jgi:hypothetical protein